MSFMLQSQEMKSGCKLLWRSKRISSSLEFVHALVLYGISTSFVHPIEVSNFHSA